MTHFSPVVARLVQQMLNVHAVAIRDIGAGEEPFEYSSGNKGPGYVMVKALVSQQPLLEALIYQLAVKFLDRVPDIEYVAGNATGGMIPAWIMREALQKLTGRTIPYMYIRGSRKVGGHGEQLTGNQVSDFFKMPRKGMVLEELVNFAQTTTNSALAQREVGHKVDYAATILFYDHPNARKLLADNGIELVHLFTMSELLELIEQNGVDRHLIDEYRAFLLDPTEWQIQHGITPRCRERDSNSHDLRWYRRGVLNPLRLPISPSRLRALHITLRFHGVIQFAMFGLKSQEPTKYDSVYWVETERVKSESVPAPERIRRREAEITRGVHPPVRHIAAAHGHAESN
jgi:orotate phosphoribosyltransferase